MLWEREVAKHLASDVMPDYCQCNDPEYRKRTEVAHSDSLVWVPRPLCNPKVCSHCVDGMYIKTAQQGEQSQPKQRRDGNTCSLDTLHGLC